MEPNLQTQPANLPSPNLESISGQEAKARSRELDLKERMALVQQEELRRSRWFNPLVLGVFAAALGLLGNSVVAYINNQAASDLERYRQRSNLILETVKIGNPEASCRNLVSLVKMGLVNDPEGKIVACQKSPKDTLYLSAAGPSAAAHKIGSIVQWDSAMGIGEITDAVGNTHFLTAGSCSQRLLAALREKAIPPAPGVPVTFDVSLNNEAVNVDLAKDQGGK